MWGISESDKKYIDKQILRDKRRNEIMKKAKERGELAAKWLENNKLTPETQQDFNRLMKSVK